MAPAGSGCLTVKVRHRKILLMDSKPKEKTREATGQSSQDAPPEPPRSKVRDLRPEKDPMGAGRKKSPK
jgi:hypothetical protein